MDPTLFNNLLADFRNSIFSVIATSGGMMQQAGFSFLGALTAIMTVMAGIRIMFHDHQSFHKLRTFTGIVLLVWIMLQLYTRPTALLGGNSFSEMIPRFAFSLADSVGTATQQQMIAKLKQVTDGIAQSDAFSFLEIRDSIEYLMITILVALLELAMFIVVGFGYLALGALIAVGPVLIPFMLVPKLDFLFWGWLRSMIKYSFYPVIGNLVLFVVTKLMLATLNTTVLANSSSTGAIAINLSQLPLILVLFAAGIYGVFKIPSLIADVFSGTASAGQGVQQAVSSAVAAAIL